MTPRRFKCSKFREGTLDFSLEGIKLLHNDFFKQRYITINAIIPGQDRIYPNTHVCRTFFAGYISNEKRNAVKNFHRKLKTAYTFVFIGFSSGSYLSTFNERAAHSR